jgi:hypothetical protein
MSIIDYVSLRRLTADLRIKKCPVRLRSRCLRFDIQVIVLHQSGVHIAWGTITGDVAWHMQLLMNLGFEPTMASFPGPELHQF